MGFDLVGISPAAPSPHLSDYVQWIDHGYHGEMAYLARADRVARRRDLNEILPGVQSVLSVGLNYASVRLPDHVLHDPSRGIISNYAWGADYHPVMLRRLDNLAGFIRAELGFACKVYVDTGAVLERDHAQSAGLGFAGKNTCLIHPRLGSWFFLGEILVAGELEYDLPLVGVGCGTCHRCLDACPTDAFTGPHVLDARRCISYLTIELRGPVPRELRPLMGNRIYGCDICQDVCPWQRFSRPSPEPDFRPSDLDRGAPRLLDLIRLDEAGFQARFQNSPIRRIRRRGLLRNVATALGNWGSPQALPGLERALHDPEPLIRGHAAWALGRVNDPSARWLLSAARMTEGDSWVQHEIVWALENAVQAGPAYPFG